jgi:putative peptidoglycan lipid II flippase
MVESSQQTDTRDIETGSPLGGHFRLVTLATTVSRISGYLRDTLNATLFGAGWISDSYFMAIRIPSLLRDLFAEGALSNAFVPALTARLAEKERKNAWELMSQVFTLLLLLVGGLTSLGILFAPQIVYVIAHGFIQNPDKFQLTVALTRILFPFLLFVSFAALWMGALNSLYQFTVPAFAPVFMNLTQIVVGVWIWKFWKGTTPEEELRNVHLWALAMTFGFLFQWLVQVPAAWKEGVRMKWSWPPSHPGVKEMAKLMGPAVVSQSVMQVNILVNQFFASFLATGYVTYLYYGNRLFQLPFGILGVSIATVVFPLLSRQSNAGKINLFSQTLSQALSASFFVMLPCTVGIWIVAEPACHLAFQYGRFTPEASRAAAEATALYALGLVGYTGVKILLPAYYARGNSKTPLYSSLAAMLSNAGLNLAAFLCFADSHLRFWGLALASGLGAMVNLIWLISNLRKIGIQLDWKFLGREGFKSTLATLAMGITTWAALLGIKTLNLPWARFWDFTVPVLAGAGIYFILTKTMRHKGLDWVLGKPKEEMSI